MLRPVEKRAAFTWLQEHFQVTEQRACRVLRVHRSSMRYVSVRPSQEPLKGGIREIATARVSCGYRGVHVLLRREGWPINLKRVLRQYREEGLCLRSKRPKRRRSAVARIERPAGVVPNERWSMDFMSDALASGHKLRVLTVLDTCTRECVALEVATGVWRSAGGGRAHAARHHARPASGDHRGQRDGVHVARSGSLGVQERRQVGLHSTRPANGERVHREFQRQGGLLGSAQTPKFDRSGGLAAGRESLHSQRPMRVGIGLPASITGTTDSPLPPPWQSLSFLLLAVLVVHLTVTFRRTVEQAALSVRRAVSGELEKVSGARLVNVTLGSNQGANMAWVVVRSPEPIPPAEVARLNDLVNRATGSTVVLRVRSVITAETTREGYVYEPLVMPTEDPGSP